MKIKCPKCKEDAELAPDFSFVECKKCGLDMSYGEYVRYVAHRPHVIPAIRELEVGL